jgi:hypothetical protein
VWATLVAQMVVKIAEKIAMREVGWVFVIFNNKLTLWPS